MMSLCSRRNLSKVIPCFRKYVMKDINRIACKTPSRSIAIVTLLHGIPLESNTLLTKCILLLSSLKVLKASFSMFLKCSHRKTIFSIKSSLNSQHPLNVKRHSKPSFHRCYFSEASSQWLVTYFSPFRQHFNRLSISTSSI